MKRERRICRSSPEHLLLPNGEVLTVRSLCADDAEALNAFRYATYSETYFMARYPKKARIWKRCRIGLQTAGKAL